MPDESYRQFVKRVEALKHDCCLRLFEENRKDFQIKKQKTIAKNLEHIFKSALKISNRKGFQAMSMRELSREAGLSIGALYNYFPGKKELLKMMQQQRRTIARRILTADIAAQKEPLSKLQTALQTHLYLSEAMQPWFYFSYMEAKNLDPKERRAAVQSELRTEGQFTDIIAAGKKQGIFHTEDCRLTASLIKAMLQDWYLKRAKYRSRRIDVDDYARFLFSFLKQSLCRDGEKSLTAHGLAQK